MNTTWIEQSEFVANTAVRLLLFAIGFAFPSSALAAVHAERVGDTVVITADGLPFATYVPNSGGKPIVWPIIGPSGKEMTRAWPMRDDNPKEERDHVHHRSLWFTHGDVNGVDFWLEGDEGGKIVHREYAEVQGGERGRVVTRNHWVSPSGAIVCHDERTLVFTAAQEYRSIDFQIEIFTGDHAVTFGDTKEGCFGVRVPETMRELAKLGGVITNSDGKQGMPQVWGKPAKWVDYRGPVDGVQAGIAIMEHPDSFRSPTRWHVRDYGLFAANPFGLRDFEGREDIDGSHTIQPGKSILFRYRVLLHQADKSHEQMCALYDAYVAEKNDASR